jgi:hypothetical protein
VITTEAPHGLSAGETVVISGSNSTPTVNGSRVVTVVSTTTFTVPVTVTSLGTAGTFERASLTPLPGLLRAGLLKDCGSLYAQRESLLIDQRGGATAIPIPIFASWIYKSFKSHPRT